MEWWQLAFTALTTIIVTALGVWSQVEKIKWEGRTKRWEDMTQRSVDSSEQAAANTLVTQDLVRENTEITKASAENANGALAALHKAAERAAAMRAEMRSKIASSEQSQDMDELDEISRMYAEKGDRKKQP